MDTLFDTAGDRVTRMSFRVQMGEELEVIAAIVAGDTQLYHQLIRPYERSVYIMSFLCTKNEKDAETVAQETFIRAFRDLSIFRDECKFSAWLISIAHNEARKQLKRQTAIQITSPDKSVSEEMSVSPAQLCDWRELSSDVIDREEIRSLLRQAVHRLPDIYRQVLLLRDVEGLNVNDTAQILEIDASLVKVSLHRARMMLQRFLAQKLKRLA